ncbi:MAG: DUF1572 family protein [Pedobacter sp.]|nr:DUF1572 family protein [Pedobacter sp.]
MLRLRNEIVQYGQEDQLWEVRGEISNSAGNLCLHLIGNLNNYIGKEIGKSGYVRNREAEFSLKNVPQQQLLSMIEETLAVVEAGLGQLKDSELEKEFPVLVFEHKTSIEYLLVHLYGHLNYHLGQINYHRRLVGSW